MSLDEPANFKFQHQPQTRFLAKEIGILELLGLFEDTTRSPGRVTQVLRGPLGPERMESQGHLRSGGAVRGTEDLLGEAVRGTSVPHLPNRRGSHLPGLLIGPVGSMQRRENVSMVETASSSTTRARGTLLRPLLRGLVIGPLGRSLCTSGTATTGCMASALLSNVNSCITGTKPITPRATAGPVVEDEEEEAPRSPTPSPLDRQGQPRSRIDGFLGGAGRNPQANRVVVACPATWAVAPATGGSAPGCLPPCVSSWEKSERNALFFSGTTGGGPKWDQVIWRRTVDANGTVIEDVEVNSSDRRATLFRRLPRRTNIKTVFWYCDDAEIALSWRSKYFQQCPDREPLRVKIPDLPDVCV